MLVLLAGCGGEAAKAPPPPPAETPAATAVATSVSSPAITSIAVDPRSGAVVIGTGPALYRLDGTTFTGRVRAPQGEGTVSGQMFVRFAGPGVLLASGHPQEGTLPENLGLLRSRDAGRTWESVSGMGDADYHELEVGRGVLVAVRADSPKVVSSRDGGKTWEEHTPPAAPIDVAVDPGDPAHWAVSTEAGTFLSTNGGGTWRPRDATPGARLAWRSSGLYLVDRSGVVRRSRDGGRSWQERGRLRLGPTELAPGRGDDLYAAIPGGKVLRSSDGGASWKTVATLS
jgi:hypothetical protein